VDAPSRSVTWLRAGVGAVLALFPGRVASAAEGRPATPRACLVTRVLGVRHLVQATLTFVAPQLLTPVRGALVDGAHTATAVLLAARSPRHRRAALMNAALAATFCGLDMARAHDAQDQRVVEVEPVMQAPDTSQQHTPEPEPEHAPEPERRELPGGADRFSLGLGEDSYLERAKLIAGAVTAVILVGMFVTSLSDAQSRGWTVALMVLPVAIVIALGARLRRHRTERRL
jgi:hypothetical protein